MQKTLFRPDSDKNLQQCWNATTTVTALNYNSVVILFN